MKSPIPLTRDRATCLLVLHNNHWYITDFMRDYYLYANIKPPKARDKTIKILFVSQIISLHCVRVRKKKVYKLELFAEWIFVLCACGNLKTISLL